MNENSDTIEDEQEYYAVRPNKTQLKRDLSELFTLGETMSQLTVIQLQGLGLPDNIYKAITEVAQMPLKSARKRQLKYIAAQLNKIDLESIQEKFDRIKSKSVHADREHHQAENWRDKLISDTTNKALTEFLDLHPQANIQQLRQLQRQAKKELSNNQAPKYARLLYQYIKSLLID